MTNAPNQPDAKLNAGDSGIEHNTDYVMIQIAELDALRAQLAAALPSGSSVDGRTAPGQAELPLESSGQGHDLIAAHEIETRDRRLAELERTCKAAVRDRELASSLADRSLVPGAAAQLIKLWRDEFDVFYKENDYHVASRDGRTVAQAVTEWLGSPDYSHFCLPTSRGGTGARDASRPANHATPGSPRNLGEAIVTRWREESASRTDNLLKPIGLRRQK
jgi:hypothetical protein